MKTKQIIVAIILLGSVAYILFIQLYQDHVYTQAMDQVRDHAQVIANSLWTFEKPSPTAYLTLAAKANGYQRITVKDTEGNTFLDIVGLDPGTLDAIFLAVKLIPQYSLETPVLFDGKKIGSIVAVWPCRTIYLYLIILLYLILMIAGVWLFLKVVDSNRTLESRVRERTAALEEEIKERKRTEKALRDSEERFRTAFENAVVGRAMALPDGAILRVNEAFAQIVGMRPEELEKKNWPEVIDPEFLPELQNTLQDVVNKKIHSARMEMKLIRKDGSPIWVRFFGAMVRDAEDVPLYVVMDVEDISSLKEYEGRLRKYEQIVSASRDLMSLVNQDFIYEAVNETYLKYHLRARDDIVGQTVWDVVGDDAFRKQIKPRLETAFSGKTVNYRNYFDYAGTGRRYMDVSYFPLFDENGNVEGVVADLRDITENKQLEEQLTQSQKMEAIGTLTGGIAHDFNNLLQAINGYSDILLLRKTKDDPDFSNLTAIKNAGERAAALVRQLLMFSRKAEIELKPIEINHEVEMAYKILRRTIPKMIDIELRLGNRIWAINADHVQIEQIILNLGTNAADAMPDGGRLLIETENTVLDEEYAQSHLDAKPGHYVLLTVSDTGQGMEKEIMQKIYDPFFTTKSIGRGTGLGLASVYGIVQSHGGYISCYSEVGQGTTFKVYLPAIEQSSMVETSSIPEFLPGGNESVLLVDDEEWIRDYAREVLTEYGYTVYTASSGEEALAIYNSSNSSFDLVILDIGMPGMGGHKCLSELIRFNPAAKIIIASGYSVNGQANKSLESGAAGYLGKPYKTSELLGKVRAILDQNKT
jgi:two-component system cell cycle sensor histidine kinase/response regulator CckA